MTPIRIRVLFPLILFAATIAPVHSQAQEITMEQMMALAQPGPEHKILAKFAGEWTVDMGFNMEMKPGGEMTKTKGASSAKLILGGRFLQFENEAAFMGQQFHNIQIIGYDRRYKKFIFFGIDDMGTYYITAEGSYDEQTNTISMSGVDTWPLPDGGKKTEKFTMTYTLDGLDKFSFKVFFADPEGHMYEMVGGTATRK